MLLRISFIIGLITMAVSGALCQEQKVSTKTPFARQDKLALRGARPSRTAVPRFEKLELTLDLAATYDNPFDPDDVLVQATFTSPRGKTVILDGFLDQAFTRKLENGEEKIESAGNPVWKVRFAPDVEGTWRYRVTAKDRSGTVNLPEATLRVTASPHSGFIRRSRANPAMFAFEGEKPFFAVGENMGWGGKRGTFDYDDWLAALGKSGGNWIRLWMSSWNCALEWSDEPKGDWRNGTYYGVGVYSLGNAWKLDTILDIAERNNIYVMVCFGTYGEFRDGGFFNEGQWKANPYNVANGGPCEKPEDFWTHPTARKLYQRRLRYLMARYGYRHSVHSWEFWNEAQAPAPWVGEMARFLKGTGEFAGRAADPYNHLVTTTYGNDAVWKLPEIDITQTHHYGTGNVADHAPVIYNEARLHAPYNKPHLMGEFGIDWRKSDAEYDPVGQGTNLHNGLWAGVMSGDAGTGMIWWWDNYIHPKNVYQPFVGVRRFVDKVPWTTGTWKPLTADAPRQVGGPETFTDYNLMPTGGWGKSAATEFTVTPAGVAGNATIPQFLYSPGKADLRTTPTFRVNYARPGKFVVHVDEVSANNTLRILLDGKPVRDITLSATPPADANVKPEYETTEHKPEYNIYQAKFNKDYSIDVPAGEHTITLDVTTGDWITITGMVLTNYRSSRFPEVNLYGLTNGQSAILWIKNALYNWKNVSEKRDIPVLKGLETAVRGLPAGRYQVEWWDTKQGTVTRTESISSVNGALPLRLPELATDVAVRITKG